MQKHFKRYHHNAVLNALRSLDGELLSKAKCFFGGGTAIALALNEYRQSIDIDFLCADQDGYRMLRNAVWGEGLKGLIKSDTAKELRELRSDQYGIRTVIGVGDAAIKFEIVREARIPLSGTYSELYKLPVLDFTSMCAEKLLANADRGNDRKTFSRDIIDLTMLSQSQGGIPEAAFEMARSAYGRTVDEAYEHSIQMISDRSWLRKCMKTMDMDAEIEATFVAEYGWDTHLSEHSPDSAAARDYP